jgi:hypothetical protein
MVAEVADGRGCRSWLALRAASATDATNRCWHSRATHVAALTCTTRALGEARSEHAGNSYVEVQETPAVLSSVPAIYAPLARAVDTPPRNESPRRTDNKTLAGRPGAR